MSQKNSQNNGLDSNINNIMERIAIRTSKHGISPSGVMLFLVFALFLQQLNSTNPDISIMNVQDNQYQKIFFIQQKKNHLFLTLSCKQQNMLSILISTSLVYQLAPRFNIYGNRRNIPKMGSYNVARFDECPVTIRLNTSNLIQVQRMSNMALLLSINQVTFQELHHKFVLKDESQKWGMGQRFQKSFHLKDGKWTIYNRDKPWKIDEGNIGSSDQTYGHHPVYLAREKLTRLYHLVYFRITHGIMIQSSQESDQIVFNSVGGNIHLIVICGEKDPESVIEQYHSYIGESHIPPFWSLGYHQSRWGYHNLGYIENVVLEFNKHKIPLDCIWADLDYMQEKQIFTVDQKRYPSKLLNEMIELHEIHFVPLLDVAIAVKDEEGVQLGKELDVFMKKIANKNQYVGEVWPGKVHYIDYLHPNSSKYWYSQLQRLNNKIKFSGIWLDMNEPTNFAGGEFTKQTLRLQYLESINCMTIDADLKHYSSTIKNLFHREVHSYYGHLSAVPTFQFLERDGRPFIISRSTSVGSGMFAGHWTGDNVANWQFLRLSISGNFLFQIFGIQMVGADICGFYKDTSEELCSRWMQLGSFYPFARNHNHEGAISQEPYQLGQILLETSKYSLNTRYSLLKQFYTFMVMKKGKGSIFRPLSFEFYDDENVYDEQIIETQFLIGKSLMVAPIVYENEFDRYVYFPGQQQFWYKFQIDKYGKIKQKVNLYMSSSSEVLQNFLPSPPLTFLRGGFMLFINRPTTRTHQLSNNFNILAALNHDKSIGEIMGIQNYQNQIQLQQCIKHGCFFKTIIRKFEHFFHLEWQFYGKSEFIAQIIIDSIFLVSGSKKWSHNSSIIMSSSNGAMNFIAVEIQM